MVKLCKDCRFFAESGSPAGGQSPLCFREGRVDLIYGRPLYLEARVERLSETYRAGGGCGPEGKFFERKPSLWQRLIARLRRTTFALAGFLLLFTDGSAWRHVLWGCAVFIGLLALVVITTAFRW